MIVVPVERKSLIIRPSGRSTDFIAPSFGFGCLYNCTYCYMKRHNPDALTISKNYTQILTEINSHANFAVVDKPNQTHEKYITYDISCNEDFALHLKYYDWRYIFDFFKEHPIAMGSLATKFVNPDLLNYDSGGKIRIRFSLMPGDYAKLLEPNTSPIVLRIRAINSFIEAGYDVHINFSPVIVHDNWLLKYQELFKLVDDIVENKNKNKVKAEVIFLTHNTEKHYQNVERSLTGEELIWQPKIQETKISQFGGKNLRYKIMHKHQYIKEFIKLHDLIIPWNTIRYIF